MNWLAVALSLGRLQKKEGNKKAEWQPKGGKRRALANAVWSKDCGNAGGE